MDSLMPTLFAGGLLIALAYLAACNRITPGAVVRVQGPWTHANRTCGRWQWTQWVVSDAQRQLDRTLNRAMLLWTITACIAYVLCNI